MNGKDFDYNFGQKRNWRRSVWNAIKEKLSVPVGEAVVLYLAGEKDLDRPVAISKGFKPWNLIAIDRDEQIVKHLKNSGTLAIKGDFLEVIKSWYGHQEIHVIHADFCCGLINPTKDLAVALVCADFFPKGVLSINLMRGRDSFVTEIKKEHPMLAEYKHRGQIFHWGFGCCAANWLFKSNLLVGDLLNGFSNLY
jgi:hypothetical protein